jgi:2-oxoglutarate ferredoxin oxidoreductase subunit alpha
MARKRLRKAATISASPLLPLPRIEGEVKNCPLVVSWGSTYETLAEARRILLEKGTEFAHLHLTSLWPVPQKIILDYLEKASHFFVVENNVGAELTTLLRAAILREPDQVILRLDGRPFHVTELVNRLGEVLP